MAQVLEFSGRLVRADKRPANPGRYDLLVGVHASEVDPEPLWEEAVRDVEVVPGGFFWVLLGRTAPLEGSLFEEVPRWVSVRVLRGREVEPEDGPRVPLAGSLFRLEERVEALEQAQGTGSAARGVRADLEQIEQRLESLETEVESSDLDQQVSELSRRLDALDGEEGRVVHIEDELEDLVGPEGDVVDLNERMDRIEGQAPDLIASLRAREAEMARERVGVLRKEVDQLSGVVGGLRELMAELRLRVEQVASRPMPSPEELGAVSRQGDTMTGGLIINRGGLEVLSGGVTCRGATVNSLEASNLVKAPKVIADAIELRGDFTVDNSHRALQVRLVEGRQGSSRKDGALFLNGRSGHEVVVGTAEEARGMQVHGPLAGRSYQAEDVGVAQAFDVYGSIEPGQVACVRPDGGKVEFSKAVAEATVVGVCVERAGLAVGGSTVGGRALVVLHGVAAVRADLSGGPIQAGDLLVSGPQGVARKADAAAPAGVVLGKALAPLGEGQETVTVLVGAR